VAPNFNLGQLLNQHANQMLFGDPANTDPLIKFILAGPANNGPGCYHFEKMDIALRVSIAWSLRPESDWGKKLFGGNDRTVIRAGFSKVYDRFGLGLLKHLRSKRSFRSRDSPHQSGRHRNGFQRSTFNRLARSTDNR
jgi:hypothetical protein